MKMELYDDEIGRLRHALGIDNWMYLTTEKELTSHRNRYCAQNPSEICDMWEKFVDNGLAERTTPLVKGKVFYSVTEKGIKALETAIDIKINIVE